MKPKRSAARAPARAPCGDKQRAPAQPAKPALGAPVLRGRVWVETLGGASALTPAGADLLEQIHVSGSLSEAARRLQFSYRRGWLLVDAMNHNWPQPLVNTAIGGRNGGGAIVTGQGHAVLRAYGELQLQLEHLLDSQSDTFARNTRSPLAE